MHVVYNDEVDQIQFDRAGLTIGIELPGRVNVPWMELDREDLLVLAKLLNTPLTADGASAASEHPMLKLLAEWAAAGARWIEKHTPNSPAK